MSKTVRTFGSTVRATLDARAARTGETLSPMPDGHLDHVHNAAVERWRVESFVLLADAEGQRLGKAVLDARERRNAVRRRDRAGAGAALSPEGRLALREAAAHVEAGRQAARMFARAGVAFRPAVADGFASGAKRIAEKGFRSISAQEDTIAAGLLRAVGLHVMGEAVESGSDVLTKTRSARDERGVTGRVQLAGFRDLIGAAQGMLKTAAILDETATRAESVYRDEEARRTRARRIRATVAPALALEPRTLVAAMNEDVSGPPYAMVPGDEEHGRDADGSGSPSASRDDLSGASRSERDSGATSTSGDPIPEESAEPSDAVLRAFVADAIPDPRRGNRLVPKSIFDRPVPSASTGADWRARMDEEAAELAAWERQRGNAVNQIRMKGTAR